jgi:small-conductance mechanosensitive channel
VYPTDLIRGLQANLAWAPPWTISVAVAVFALGVVQLVYDHVIRLLRRTVMSKSDFWGSLLARNRGPGRMALVLAALSWSVHAAPFPAQFAATIQHGLLILFIVLCGWAALTTLDIAAELYMRRDRLDEADKLIVRKHLTEVRILQHAAATLVIAVTAGIALMTIPAVRQLGVSLLAAGGAAGIIVGLALQPVLSNLIAGVQIALTQPIRIGDAVFIQNEFGRVEEINTTTVVVKLWDQRRLIAPLKFFLDQPFQNWSREGGGLIGAVLFQIDYRIPVAQLRARFEAFVRGSPLWDGRQVSLQVTEAREHSLELRGLVSAANADALWALRCEAREQMVDYLRREFPDALPRIGIEFSRAQAQAERSLAGPGPGDQRVQQEDRRARRNTQLRPSEGQVGVTGRK